MLIYSKNESNNRGNKEYLHGNKSKKTIQKHTFTFKDNTLNIALKDKSGANEVSSK